MTVATAHFMARGPVRPVIRFAALLVALVCLAPAQAAERPLTFAWFSELSPEHSYWRQNLVFAKAVADDLGVTLVPYYVESDQLRYRKMVASLKGPHNAAPVDGLIFLNMKQQDRALLEAVQEAAVPAISNVLSMDYAKVGAPRDRFPEWIGEIVDDEEDNGYQLALRLIDAARARGLHAPDGTLHVVAIQGKASDSAAIRRARGLERALAEQDDVTFHQSFYAYRWSRAEGRDFASVAFRRYPDVAILWAANDDTLLGVLDAAADHGRLPGADFVTGSIDGTPEVVRRVAAGDVVCTIGGLALHSGWAVVLLHDYLRGVDFENDTGLIIENENIIIDQRNAHRYLERFGDGDWSDIDFRRFSKAQTPTLERYDLSLEVLLDED